MLQPLEQKLAITGAFMQAAERLPAALYSAGQEWNAVLEQLENGVLTEQQADDQLRAIAIDVKHVVIRGAHAMRNYASQANECQIEIDRLTARKKRLEAREARTAEWIKERMREVGVDKIEGGIFTLFIHQNPISVQVDDDSLVPNEFRRTTVTTSVDKVAVRKHCEATGEVISGTRLVRGESLVLR